MRLSVAFHTLGCKLNQLESEALADSFRVSGAELLSVREASGADHLDLLVLNTCTVTGKAEQKARRVLRTILGSHPDAVALVTGCYAQVDPAAVESLHERAVVVPGDEKDSLLGLPSWLAEFWQGHGDLLEALREWKTETLLSPARAAGPDNFAFNPVSFAFHSRPALKVQDGCDNRCSYCRVCLARGPSRSLSPEEVVSRARALEDAGRSEIVLTGINLSQYRDGSLDFPALLERLLQGTQRVAFRISSYEPDRIDSGFLSVFADERVRPHVHLAVQSGSDPVLARMGRAYRRDAVLGAIEALRRVRHDPFLAADIIAGFPGESDEDFAATAELCETASFAWIHAFPFSPRPGTRAEGLRPRVPERIAGERVARLGELARRGRAAYRDRWIGAEVEVVLEGRGEGLCEDDELPVGGGRRYATAENYLKLLIEELPGHLSAGSPVRCSILRAAETQEAGVDARAVFRGQRFPA